MRNLDEIINEMLLDLKDRGIEVEDFYSNPVIYSIVEASAHQIQMAEFRADDIVRRFFIEDSKDDELDKRLKERGLLPRAEGSKARGTVILGKDSSFILNNLVIKGTTFKTLDGAVNLVVLRDTDVLSGTTSVKVPVECSVTGKAGELKPFTELTYSGIAINEVEWLKVDENGLFGGKDRESDDEVKARLLDDIRNPAGSGNKNHYIKWAKEIPEVGKILVIPEWEGFGTGTVKVVITDKDRAQASKELIDKVINYLDPASRLGEGQAPIGAKVTVDTVELFQVNLSYKLSVRAGFKGDEVRANIRKNLNDYFKKLTLEDTTLRYAYAGNLIFSTDGVDDYSDLLINGQNKNLIMPLTALAVVGDMSE